MRTSLLLHHELGDRWRAASVLEELAGGLLARIEPARAAELLGAAQALRDTLQAPLPPAERPDYDEGVQALRHRLGSSVLDRHWSHGRALGLEHAIHAATDAAQKLSNPEAPGWRHAFVGQLTDREYTVLELLSAGHTNREIAAELFISPSTAGVHVSNILRKLGVKSRVQAATLAHQLSLPAPSAGGAEPGRLQAGS